MSRTRDEKSYKWFVRITYPHAECKSKMQLVYPWAKTILALSHVGLKNEREHIHLAFELTTMLTKQAIDVRIKKIFPVKGSDYSSKIWDGKEDVLAYMFHDVNHEIIANKGHTDDDLARYKAMHEATDKVVQHNKQKAPGRKVDIVIEHFKQIMKDEDVPAYAITSRDVGKYFLQMVRSGEMYEPGDFKLKAMIEEVKIKLFTDDEDFSVYCDNRLNTIYCR